MRVQQGGYGVIVETLAELAVAVLGVWGDGCCIVRCHVTGSRDKPFRHGLPAGR